MPPSGPDRPQTNVTEPERNLTALEAKLGIDVDDPDWMFNWAYFFYFVDWTFLCLFMLEMAGKPSPPKAKRR